MEDGGLMNEEDRSMMKLILMSVLEVQALVKGIQAEVQTHDARIARIEKHLGL